VTRLTIFALTSDIVADMKRFAFAFILLGACGGDDGGGTHVDAPASAKVATVDCSTVTADATVTTTMMATPESDVYMAKNTTITQGQVVKFVMPNAHNVAPTAGTDAGVSVGFGETKCLRFTQSGTYGFLCSSHGFTGSIVVN